MKSIAECLVITFLPAYSSQLSSLNYMVFLTLYSFKLILSSARNGRRALDQYGNGWDLRFLVDFQVDISTRDWGPYLGVSFEQNLCPDIEVWRSNGLPSLAKV